MSKNRHPKARTQEVNNLDILFPDKTVTIADKTLTIRELRFGEQLQYTHLLQPITKRFEQVDLNSNPEDEANNVLDILAFEYENVMQLMAICTRQSIQWIKSLTPEQGEDLMLYWWAINSRFFIRRLMRKGIIRATQAAAKITKETGETFSPPLSEQATTGKK